MLTLFLYPSCHFAALLLTDYTVIANPLDVFSLSLLNEQGIDVLFPYVPKTLIHSASGTKYIYKTFKVSKITLNGKKSNDQVEVLQQIKIPGKSTYELFLSITKALRPGAVKPYHIEDAIQLPKGSYAFSAHIAISQDSKFKAFTSPHLLVNYGIK